MSGAITIPKVRDQAGHAAYPRVGTYASASGGVPAKPPAETDYPVTADCTTCGRRIRLDHPLQMEWVHDTADPAGAAT